MLSSAKITTRSWRYYTNQEPCRAADYYLGHDQEHGRWQGDGLRRLGLEDGAAVNERELEALFARGIHPETGEQLGRAWRADGVTGFDLTFSAPKSVSILMNSEIPTATSELLATVLPGDATSGSQETARDAVVAAHDVAVRTALQYLEAHAAVSRRGTDGVEQVGTAGFAAAAFRHYTSREGDPQLHTHALVLNKTLCADGRWRSLDGHELYAHKKSAGMIYQAVLRNELERTLGVRFGEVSRDGQAEILGIPEQLLDTWSKRTHQVNSEARIAIGEYETVLGRELTRDEKAAVIKTAVLKTPRPRQS